MEEKIQETRKIICVGPKFKAFREQSGIALEAEPTFLLKSPESLVTGEYISLSPKLDTFICEVEMAVVIGKDATEISETDALNHVAGYALANDISASSYVNDGRFKMFDHTTPIGPFVTGIDPSQVTLEMRVNNSLVQRDHTRELSYSVPWLISHLSSIMTLRRGDILLTGTPANPHPCDFGDVIELTSPQLGYYKHTIRKKRSGISSL